MTLDEFNKRGNKVVFFMGFPVWMVVITLCWGAMALFSKYPATWRQHYRFFKEITGAA